MNTPHTTLRRAAPVAMRGHPTRGGYRALDIDPDFASFAADPRNTVRPPPPHVPLGKVRAAANAAMIDTAPPPVAVVQDGRVVTARSDIPLRLYRPQPDGVLPVIVFAHGGGFVWGSIDTHDGICRRLALASGMAVVSVGYRLAPEAPFPAARDDVLAAVGRVGELAEAWQIDPARLGLCGDSAGGHVALTAALALRDAGAGLRHLALIYPAVDPACASASHLRLAEGPILSSAGMRWFWQACLGEAVADPPKAAVPLAADLAGLPPTVVVTAGLDPLCDEGDALARRLTGHGVAVNSRRFDGAPHGFLSLDPEAGASHACLAFVAGAAAASLRAEPPAPTPED